jgi:thiol-disulfide isomerase/thioredoxin
LHGALLCLIASVATAAAPPRVQPGDVPFEPVGLDDAGREIRISEHKGKIVIVTFWASWCGPCLKELTILDDLQRKAGHDRIEVIAINYRHRSRTFARSARPCATRPSSSR